MWEWSLDGGCKKKHQHLQPAEKDHSLRKRDVVPQRGNDDAVLKKKVETTYFDNRAFFTVLASFLLQFCLIHLNLASLAFCTTYSPFPSCVFIVLSCWRYPSQHRYDFCAQIEICVVAVQMSLHNFALSPCDMFMLPVFTT